METAHSPEPTGGRLLERLGLHRPELRAWALYDWANSAMMTTIVTAVFPVFFARVAAKDLPPGRGTEIFALTTTVSMVLISVLAPFLGALADFSGKKKRDLGLFAGLGCAACLAMFWIGPGDWLLAAILFGLANIGASGSFVFYDALLPHIARKEEMDRVSSAGYALGYLGGGLLLAAQLLWIQHPAWFGFPQGEGLSPDAASLPARVALVSVGIWWALFSIPLFRRIQEPPRALESDEAPTMSGVRVALTRLGETFRELRRYRDAFWLLLAFLAYNDGIGTIIRMAAIYAAEVGVPDDKLLLAIVLVQFVGIPFAFFFGWIAGKIGAKRSILLAIGVYIGISALAYRMETTSDFFLIALLVAAVQGGAQALSRSLFASMIPKHKSGEFFGLFSVLEKFSGIFGPAAFALAMQLTGSSRLAVASVIFFFVLGAIFLAKVDVERGRRESARPLA